MKNKLYLATAIVNFIVSGADIAIGYYILAPMLAACGGVWLYLWSREG